MANETFMKRALKLARRGRTSPNPMVGAVVVRDGKIVGEGFHPKAGEPHAEVFALDAAGQLAIGADLYVTLEPCCHHGKTPPCTDVVIQSGIKRVFTAMVDPNPQVGGKGIEILRSNGIDVQVGLMEAEACELNRGFIKRVTTGLPFVLWKAAMTLDGKIATRTGDSRWVTSEKSRKEVHKLRCQCDAVMVGIGTVLADDPELTVRGIRGAVNPLRVVVGGKNSISPNARVLNSEAETMVVPPTDEGRVDLQKLMIDLAKKGINNVLLEGGGELAASMLSAGLVDRGIIFLAPKIVGGRDAKTPIEGEGIELMSQALATSKPKIRHFGDDIALEFEFPEI